MGSDAVTWWLIRRVLPALLAMGLAGAAAGGSSMAAGPPDALFARGGIALRGITPEPGSVRVDGAPVSATPIPAGGTWVETAWEPREPVTLEWREDGGARSARLAAPLAPAPLLWRHIPWEGGGGFGAATAGEVTAVAFSADGARLAVGSHDGRLAVFRTATGAVAWRHQRPGRVIKHLAFAPKGDVLYAGEQGPEGRLAAYPVASSATAPLWRFDAGPLLGGGGSARPGDPYGWVARPGVYALAAAGRDVIVAFSHSWPQADTQAQTRAPRRAARARLYRLAGADGVPRWAYPAGEPTTMMISWVAASAGAAWLSLPLQWPQDGAGAEPARVEVLAGDSGRPAFAHPIAPLPPHGQTAFWRGVALHPDGTRLAAATQDGRAFLFAEGARGWSLSRQWPLVSPVRLSATTVTATNGTVAATAREAIFITGPTFLPLAYGGGAPAGDHPRANTVFAYSWEGAPRWVWRLEHDLQGLAQDGSGRLLALLQGTSRAQGAGDFNGVTLLSLGRDGAPDVRFRHALAGRPVYGGVALSPDGRWLAVAEAPRAVRGDARPQGRHGVVVLR